MRAATDNVRLAPECNNILMGPEKVAEFSRADIGTFFQNLAPHIKMSLSALSLYRAARLTVTNTAAQL